LNILVLHAYSRRNRGDGLLVDLTIDLLREVFGPDINITLVAAEASSFRDLVGVYQHPLMAGGLASRIRSLIGFLTSPNSLSGPFKGPTLLPDLIVGVGGGYLRTEGGPQSIKTLLAHGTQLKWATSSGIPTIYLPQSIGPLRGLGGKAIKRLAMRIDRVYLRDDRSVQQMHGPNVHRFPDLAVMSIARSITKPRERGGRNVVLVARDLRRPKQIRETYIERLRSLKDALHCLPAVQSEGRGNDDPHFYNKIGWREPAMPLPNALAAQDTALVVSVRLHGALEAILHGTPAIHLSYERKGFGAFEDLGIGEFVHNSNSFDLEKVLKLADQIIDNPAEYWNRVNAAKLRIADAYDRMKEDIRNVVC